MSRPDLLALTPEAVAALANLGLVKRAQREIAAGQGPSLEEDESTGLVTGTFADGVKTQLPRGVPLRDAPCSCGATAVCRHRIATVLAYPAWHGASAKAEASWSPSCFGDDDLLKLVGKRIMTRAKDIVRTGIIIELEGGGAPTAKLPTCAVKFHVPRDLAYARCDCRAAVACEHVVVASWAFRRAEENGAPVPCTIELGAARASSADEQPLALAMQLVEHVVMEGVSHLGDADRPRIARVRAALASARDLLWPATIVDDLEIALEAYRARSARYRTSDVATLLASLAARTRAVKNSGELPRRFLLGSDEERETALDHVRLVSLGARVYADGRTRDAEVYLADPDSGIVLVASKRFEYDEKTTPEEGPDLARRTLTGRVSVGALAHGQLVTRAAKRHANHAITLATTRTAQTSIAPSSGDWGALPSPLLVRDFRELADGLRERPPRLLRPRILASQMRVLALGPEHVATVGYRPGDQELVAAIRDAEGGSVLLVRRYTRSTPHALDVLARALAGSPRFVAGEVRLGAAGVEIEPTAIVTDRVLVPDLDRESASLDDLPVLASSVVAPMHIALEGAQALLEEALHDGIAHPRGNFADRAARAADALSKVGLVGAEKRMRTLGEAPSASGWLDAMIRLDLTREATLAGLRPDT
jgi:hypothetical protein